MVSVKGKSFIGVILKIALAIWIILWVSFICRELFRKRYFYDYKELVSRPAEGKRSYVTGDRFYNFLMFCKHSIPEGATFDITSGVKEGSIDMRRAVYYLYPRLRERNADYTLKYYDQESREERREDWD